MLKSKKGKQNIRIFERVIPIFIVVICILLFRGTGICACGTGGMHDACTSNFKCSNRYFCEKGMGNCDGEGLCEDKPMSCDDVWEPVCGCDGTTYPNECEARAGAG